MDAAMRSQFNLNYPAFRATATTLGAFSDWAGGYIRAPIRRCDEPSSPDVNSHKANRLRSTVKNDSDSTVDVFVAERSLEVQHLVLIATKPAGRATRLPSRSILRTCGELKTLDGWLQICHI